MAESALHVTVIFDTQHSVTKN